MPLVLRAGYLRRILGKSHRKTDNKSRFPNGSLTQGFNPYHYTGNYPTTRTDPSGHNWLDTFTGAVNSLTYMLIDLIGVMRWVNSDPNRPQWIKDFINVLVVFAVQTVMMLIVLFLVNVFISATGIGNSMIGRALVLVKLRVIGAMTNITKKCLGNQTCRRMASWIIQNPDCGLELGSYLFSNRSVDVASTATGGGSAPLLLDTAFLAKECADRAPGGGTGFTHGNGNASTDPPSLQAIGDLSSWPSTPLPDFLKGGKRDIRDTRAYYGIDPVGNRSYVGITNNITNRTSAHGDRFSSLDEVISPILTRGEARAVEEALMTNCGKTPDIDPALVNELHSISPTNHGAQGYAQALDWGTQFVKLFIPGAC